ncbi:uncharacterized protein LOC127837806 isoform X3 [Dreissena polymorpha]|uniref:uncharacterized protein LOC127837806 isoform X3 n=1 Tax=Dreissena polymorpha TaxID=45954 RepID=UPI00226522C0|nr:uncharacterized protein LOC127837806 isoform X3 [Dreissena polymorpha]XP_052221167.1 uncharacterized protein LOC127837806 isoform X3 [Dreissena polymorpha]
MWAVAPTNKIGERQPLRRADNAGAGSSRLAGYGIAVPKHGAVVFGNSEHVSGSGSSGSGSVQEPIPTTATFTWNTWGPITESAEVTFNWQDSNIGMLANYGNITSTVTVIPMC